MPQLGETVAEGKITKWFKSAGEQVKPGDNLFEIETDKVSMEVPSTTTGVLAEIRVPAGDIAPVGAIVAVIADGLAAQPSRPAAAAPSNSARSAPRHLPENRHPARPERGDSRWDSRRADKAGAPSSRPKQGEPDSLARAQANLPPRQPSRQHKPSECV